MKRVIQPDALNNSWNSIDRVSPEPCDGGGKYDLVSGDVAEWAMLTLIGENQAAHNDVVFALEDALAELGGCCSPADRLRLKRMIISIAAAGAR